jgi:NAD(P)-dependent dehydrogenase (short-subunit alcohol dehydrogenase family)
MRPRRLRDLDGLKVFLTGAASGIGRATARLAARQGARVFLTDVDAEGLADTRAMIEQEGFDVGAAEALDVADHAAVRRFARRLTEEFGPMDVVMNIAGIAAWGTVRSLEPSTWRRQVEVNLMGPIHVIEELVPPMIDAGRGGHVVNVSSAAGVIGMPWHAAYSASKFGLRGGLRGAPLRPGPAPRWSARERCGRR